MNLNKLLTLTQQELKNYLSTSFSYRGYHKVETDYALGFISPEKNVPCLVAHLDTINTKGSGFYSLPTDVEEGEEDELQRTPTESDILVTDKYILLSPEANSNIVCLGADDRVGVQTILDILDKGIYPHVLFTTNEESGCLGSRELILHDDFDYLKEASMLIQIDRGVHEGSWNEMVFYSYDHNSIPEIFEELSKSFTLAQGSYTDVAVLGSHFNKPIVNISASYAHEHTRREFINRKAYEDNLQGLTNFLLWMGTQDTSNWVYTSKVITYTTKGVQPKWSLGVTRDFPKGKTIHEVINSMYKYGDKKSKINYSWNFYKQQIKGSKSDIKALINQIESMIIDCYMDGVYVENYPALTELFNGTIWNTLYTEE